MNGPEHYRNAERLTQLALDQWESGKCNIAVDITLPQAQIAATLALAAAQVETAYATNPADGIRTDWLEVIA